MAEDTAQELIETRRELEAYVQELHDLREPLLLAVATEDPVPMTLLQVKSTITALEGLKPRMNDAHQFLVRKETDGTIAAQDTESRRKTLKEYDQARESAFCLKYVSESAQHLSNATREIKRLEKNQAENPHKDYSKATTFITKEMASLRSSLDHAVLEPDDELWEKCEDLEDRLMEILSHEVVPLDTKDLSKPLSKPSYKIAALVVPKFNGKIENWISFWEEFDHAINKKLDMDDCTKLVYLKQAILDPSLKSTIADLGIQDKAYSTAIKLLQDRFNKPRIIHRQCCESLKNIPTNTNSRASLTDLADKLQHILTGLTRLESLGASEILTSMAEMSMNKELKHEWLTHTSKLTTTPPVEKVIAFIRERADQAEREEIISSTKSSNEKNRHSKPAHHKNRGSHVAVAPPQPTQSTPAVAATTAPASAPQSNRGASQAARIEYPPCRYSCPLCPENHYPYHCDVFKGYTPRQRNNHVQTHSLCSSCLKPGHAVAACRSTFRCKTCRALHNSLLHEDQPSVATPAIGSTNAAISKENYKLKDTLFMTADVLLTGTNGITLDSQSISRQWSRSVYCILCS